MKKVNNSKIRRIHVIVGVIGMLSGGSVFSQNLSSGVMDVGKMASAHVSEDNIINYINGSGVAYHLTPDDIIYLNGQGVTPNVMARLQSGGPAPAPAVQEPPPAPAAPPPDASSAPSPEINLPYFHAQLDQYGTWVDLPPYGAVWHPGAAINDPNWRPYCQGGHWVMTDAGWYWQADDPWGAAVFHYGRWVNDDNNGWVWVPAYNWAPSWVAWRRAEGVYGWAPLPPRAEFVAGVGISFGGVAVGAGFNFGLGASAFTFVGYDHLWAHDYGVVMLPEARVDIVFQSSVIQNSYHVVGGRFVVEGFGREDIAIRTGHPVQVVSINKQVIVEHTTVVKNVTDIRNVTIRNNVTTVRNVTNVRDVNNVKNVNNLRNVNNTSNVRNVNTVNNTRNTANTRNETSVNERKTPAGERTPPPNASQHPVSGKTPPESAAQHQGTVANHPAAPAGPGSAGPHYPATAPAHPAAPGTQPKTSAKPMAKPGAEKKPLPEKGPEGQPQKPPQ
jgi:hypothetical protein